MRYRGLPAMLVLTCLLACAAGCGNRQDQPAPQSLPTVELMVGSRTFTLEIASDEPARARGLMFRDSMPADHGMLFVFPDEQLRGFYMHNTAIPLDIIFLDAGGAVVSVASMKPYDLSTTSSRRPAKFAIELNQGQAAVAGVNIGNIVHIPPAVASTGK